MVDLAASNFDWVWDCDMLKLISCVNILLLAVQVRPTDAAIPPLARERQVEIIQNYLYVTGKNPNLPSPALKANEAVRDAGGHPLVKCGMSAVADFVINRHKLDSDLLMSAGLNSLRPRPVLDTFYDSPGGWFKIHYNRTGPDTVYQASRQTLVPGVPDFVAKTADIADSVYLYDSTVLGYPSAPRDSFYPAGGDARYDIYLINLSPNFYGLAYLDSIYIDGPGGQRATSYMELSKDYQGLDAYKDRPLDAIRVTVAHEYFHAIQFGIDFTELDGIDEAGFARRYWMEISAVWMEQEQYPNIPDYYGYLPFFYDKPTTSLQQFKSFLDFHPYGSCVFAIYLSERYNRDFIRFIWERCGALGPGPQFFEATDEILREKAGSTLPQAFAEFALWNYFTGARAAWAPPGVGYKHRSDYPAFPDDEIPQHGEDSAVICTRGCTINNLFEPEHNGASYIQFVHTREVQRRYWAKGTGVDSGSICNINFSTTSLGNDSTEVPIHFIKSHCGDQALTCAVRGGCHDTTAVSIDSVFTVLSYVDSLVQPWGLSVVYHYEPNPTLNIPADSHFVESFLIPGGSDFSIQAFHPELCQSITLIFTPSSTEISRYVLGHRLDLAYLWSEIRQLDSSSINRPAMVLTPYPNPAVVSRMPRRELTFRFQMPTDSQTLPAFNDIRVTIDLYNVAGEHINACDTIVHMGDLAVPLELRWNMKNAHGSDVASGVYIGVAKLYSEQAGSDSLVTESRVKVAIIR